MTPEQTKQVRHAMRRGNTLLVAYEGGGYEGCHWEWNFAVVYEKKWHSIFASGRRGAKTYEAFWREFFSTTTPFKVEFYTMQKWQVFAKEHNIGNVVGVGKFLVDHRIYPATIPCTHCGKKTKPKEIELGGERGCGGIATMFTEGTCPECEASRCDECNKIVNSFQEVTMKYMETKIVCDKCYKEIRANQFDSFATDEEKDELKITEDAINRSDSDFEEYCQRTPKEVHLRINMTRKIRRAQLELEVERFITDVIERGIGHAI